MAFRGPEWDCCAGCAAWLQQKGGRLNYHVLIGNNIFKGIKVEKNKNFPPLVAGRRTASQAEVPPCSFVDVAGIFFLSVKSTRDVLPFPLLKF